VRVACGVDFREVLVMAVIRGIEEGEAVGDLARPREVLVIGALDDFEENDETVFRRGGGRGTGGTEGLAGGEEALGRFWTDGETFFSGPAESLEMVPVELEFGSRNVSRGFSCYQLRKTVEPQNKSFGIFARTSGTRLFLEFQHRSSILPRLHELLLEFLHPPRQVLNMEGSVLHVVLAVSGGHVTLADIADDQSESTNIFVKRNLFPHNLTFASKGAVDREFWTKFQVIR
jgi:hypothetical protein